MKVLVIPDVHLKPFLFEQAAQLMKNKEADRAVCLMDIADDWKQQFNIDLYIQSYDAAIRFAETFPETLWCCGNHDVSYLWNRKESGYSPIAPLTVCKKMRELKETLPSGKQLAFLHRIDNVVFSHGGLADAFVRKYVPSQHYHNIDAVIDAVNAFDDSILWQEISPIWYRPQYYKGKLYKPRKLLQVVGHTPVKNIVREGNLISCDVFSTYRDGQPIGTREFPVIDTETWDMWTKATCCLPTRRTMKNI